MIKRSAYLGILCLAFIVFTAASATAQEFRGTISGTVSDPNGAVVPGATVTVINVETNVSATTTTNDSGAYNFPLLLPGKYKVSTGIEGFKTAVREQLTLNVDDRLTIDFNLEIGATTEVNIVADTELVERGSVTTGTVITERQITELPLSEGAAYNLATQAPGVSYTGNPNFTGPTANGNLAAFRTNGAVGNQITLDGSPNLTFDGGVAYTPPADALSQFKIQTNAFDAQNGFTAGSTVNVAVKSGTNDFHGSAYYFNRPGSLTANNFFSNRAGIERAPRSYYRVGGQINGPLYFPGFGEGTPLFYNGKDKTFFMFSYEKQLDKRAEPETFTVPTALMRTGDFSELLNYRDPLTGALTPIQIYDPATAVLRNTACAAGSTGTTVCRTPFAGNIIPAARINPAALAFINRYPAPNLSGVVDNYFSNQVLERPYDSYLMRIDHNFNGNHRIFGKFFYSKSDEDRYNFIGDPGSITQGFEFRTNKGGNIDYTATLSSNFILDIRSSLNDFVQDRAPANFVSAGDLGFTGIAALSTSSVFPRFDFTNYDTLGAERADFNEGLTRNFKLFSVQPTLTQIAGNHTIKYGYDFRRLMENRTTNGYNAGRFMFTGTYTAPASNSSSTTVTTAPSAIGRDLASFLLGIPVANAASLIEQSASYDVNSNYHAFFVQDDWRLTRKLTLNLGLRYDLETGLREANGQFVTGFDTTTASPLRAQALANYNTSVAAGTLTGVPITAFQNLSGGLRFASGSGDPNQGTDKNNIQPRFGISYAINDKTVIRGGFGIFTSSFQIQPINQSGFTASTLFSPTTNNGLTFTSTLSNPFPNGLNPAIGSSLGLNTLLGNSFGTLNATGPTDSILYTFDRQNANYARFVVGIQRELPFNIGVEATYVHSRGYDLPVLRQLNYIPREYLNDFTGVTDAATITARVTAANSFLNAAVPNPFRGLVPQNANLNGATIQRRFLLTQFPQFQDVIVTEYNGSSRYDSIQLQATKRLSQGLSFNTSYTFSRDREKTRRLNPQDEELNDSLSVFDRPHRFTLSSVFEIPFGRGREYFSNLNPIVDAIFGGWQLNAVYEWQSGEPLVLQNAVYTGDITQLENLIGQRNEQGLRYGVDVPAFNTTGFISLGNNYTLSSQSSLRLLPYTLDNFRNQPFQKFDAGLTKNFTLREGMRLQVRVEAINAFNSVYLGNGLQLGVTNAAFGRVSAQRNLPRDIQLGARFTF